MNVLVDESRQNLIAMISDRSRDAYGCRVRRDYTGYSNEELVAELDSFDRVAQQVEAEDEAREARAFVRWTNHVANLMEDHGVDRITAIRWDRAAMGAEDDFGYYCYLWGINESRFAPPILRRR
jgi:hypothetical protein